MDEDKIGSHWGNWQLMTGKHIDHIQQLHQMLWREIENRPSTQVEFELDPRVSYTCLVEQIDGPIMIHVLEEVQDIAFLTVYSLTAPGQQGRILVCYPVGAASPILLQEGDITPEWRRMAEQGLEATYDNLLASARMGPRQEAEA